MNPARVCALALFLANSLAVQAQSKPPSLPLIRTARQAHTLSREQAALGYPVHLDRAQITFTVAGYAFVQDRTDGIFALTAPLPQTLHAGDLVSVTGVTAPGDLVPIIERARFQILGHALLPPAPPISMDRLTMGAWDSQLVTLEGIIRSLTPIPGVARKSSDAVPAECAVLIASGQDQVEIVAVSAPDCDRRDLVDAKVRVKAVAAGRFNQRRQLIGIRAFTQDLSSLQVEEPAPADPFRLPLTDTAGVMRLDRRDPGHRVRVRGIVTSTSGSQQFSLMDSKNGIFVHTDVPVQLAVGQVLDVVGFPSWGGYTSVLEDSIYRQDGHAPVPLPAVLTPSKALEGNYDAEPIMVEGLLLYKSRTATEKTLLLTDGGTMFTAAIPAGASGRFDEIHPGSHLRITGICQIEVTPDKTPKAMRVLLQSPADVLVLSQPPWWTSRNARIVAALLLATVALVVAWNVVLRRRVRTQTRVISDQLEEVNTLRRQAEAAHKEKSDSLASVLSLQRDLLDAQEKLRHQATHDALTGLWNRRALLDLLGKEIERCCRTQSSMGILMLDVDHFKPVNDSFGHLAGDQVLKEIAHRIAHATRGYDISGRYGGEEFLILLLGCNREQTEAGAERIRTAIAAEPFHASGSVLSITASIGATVAPLCAGSETEILSLADLALYQAKSSGRNRTILCLSPEEIPIAVK